MKPQIPKIFAKLLYGSKFHRLKQSRGQQGIGISAAGLYGQLTTGKPVRHHEQDGQGAARVHDSSCASTRSATSPTSSATRRSSGTKEHGTRVEIELVAAYRGGRTGVQEYLEQTVVANPHLGAHVRAAEGRARSSSRA